MTGEKSIESDSNSQIQPSIPSTAIRENLVATAVHFLNNPRVNKSPLSHQTAFLLKKGLTESEINVALARASINTENVTQQTSLIPSNGSVLMSKPVVPHSIWYHIHRVGSSVIIIGIVLYGAHQIYKLYVEPWLFGKGADKNRMTWMEQQLIEMNRTLSELRRTVSELQEVLSSQKEQMNKMRENEANYYPTPLVLNDLKAEVGSIKSLLLNRHQFPSTPKVNSSIPLWQMSSTENEKTVDGNTSEEKNKTVDENASEEIDKTVNGNASEEDENTSGEKDKTVDVKAESWTDKISNEGTNAKQIENTVENVTIISEHSSLPISNGISIETEDSESYSCEDKVNNVASCKDESDKIV